jgi:PBP1b-binding outer membrane lipoprotein LpoB
MTEEKDSGFTIKDKRSFDEHGNPVQSAPSETKNTATEDIKTAQEQASSRQNTLPPEINFASFVLSLSSSALYHFGEIPDPITNKMQRNIIMAKQTIDILGMLKEKTAGNLAKEEEALLSNLLYDLRMRYVRETEKDRIAP